VDGTRVEERLVLENLLLVLTKVLNVVGRADEKVAMLEAVGVDIVEVAKVEERLVLELKDLGSTELEDLTVGRCDVKVGDRVELGLMLAAELVALRTLDDDEDMALASAFILKPLKKELKPTRLTRRSDTILPEQVSTTDSVGCSAASVAS
jgi:hypothetical protein